MSEIAPFDGYPPETFQFFKDIAANNNREWFNEHKQEYIDRVQTPSISFLIELGEGLREIAPGITYDTRTNGAGSMMRIYRDIRFSKDKSPYKDHMGMNLWDGPNKKESPGFHFWFNAEGGALYGGYWQFPKPFLTAYREAVIDDRTGQALQAAVDGINATPGFRTGGEQLKRVPPGYDKAHPLGDLLRYKGLYARGPKLTPKQLQSPKAIDLALGHARVMAPMHRWMVELDESLRG